MNPARDPPFPVWPWSSGSWGALVRGLQSFFVPSYWRAQYEPCLGPPLTSLALELWFLGGPSCVPSGAGGPSHVDGPHMNPAWVSLPGAAGTAWRHGLAYNAKNDRCRAPPVLTLTFLEF